ncbi:MAG: hypothetical protein JSV20_02020, partial [Candidatus Bathyarchaeota archaeon]
MEENYLFRTTNIELVGFMSKKRKKRKPPRRKSTPPDTLSLQKRARKRIKAKPPKTIRVTTRVSKRDGRIQSFDRNKMVKSIRNAGASPAESELVTNRISKRLVNRETTSSTELSGMVARSLSHVNSTASRSYIHNRDLKLAYSKRVHSLSSEIVRVNQQTSNITHRIESFDNRVHGLSARISRIRQGNYRVLTHLETDQTTLSDTWSQISPDLRANTSLKSEAIRSRTLDLQGALRQRERYSNYNVTNLQGIESQLSEIRHSLAGIESDIANSLTPLEKRYKNIDQNLRKAESTVELVAQASFPWEEGETAIIAAKVKDLNNDLDGYITLTNLRFIFEHIKEIVLKKRLFIVTEKKIVREVAVHKPIGMITRLTKGRVGLLKGSGLFVEFASETGIPEMKFDTKGSDAD